MDSSEIKIDKVKFRKKVEQLYNLPTLPNLMAKFSIMAKDPNTSMAKFADELSKDQTLTSKMLRLVNSAFYGFPGRIGTVTQALIILGIDAVKGLIVTSNVFDTLTPEAYPLWRHSIMVSMACRNLALTLNIPDAKEISEESAVAGLLHDIGHVIFFLEAPEEFRLVCDAARKKSQEIWKTERELLGFDHSEIGKWICEKWTLPSKLGVPIGFHHEPEKAPEHRLRTSIVSAANIIVNALGCQGLQGIALEDFPPVVISDLKLNRRTLKNLIQKIEPELEGLSSLAPKDLK